MRAHDIDEGMTMHGTPNPDPAIAGQRRDPLFDALLAIFARKDGHAAPVPPT